jgi:hypothetical protein
MPRAVLIEFSTTEMTPNLLSGQALKSCPMPSETERVVTIKIMGLMCTVKDGIWSCPADPDTAHALNTLAGGTAFRPRYRAGTSPRPTRPWNGTRMEKSWITGRKNRPDGPSQARSTDRQAHPHKWAFRYFWTHGFTHTLRLDHNRA